MRQRYWKSNGHFPPKELLPQSREASLWTHQNWTRRYGFAIVSVLLTWASILLANTLFTFPPLILFIVPMALTVTFAGWRSGLLVLVLATLLTDFFFVHPTHEFSLNEQVFRVSVGYFIGGVFSYIAVRRAPPSTEAFSCFPRRFHPFLTTLLFALKSQHAQY